MSGEPKTLTPEQEKAAREAFETRYKGFTWWTEKYGELHPALHKDENGDYLEESQRKYWKGFQEGYAAAVGVRVEARDDAAELRAALRTLVADLEALMSDYSLRHDYTGEGHPEQVGWHDVLQGGRDNYLTNWNEAKRLAGGENEK